MPRRHLEVFTNPAMVRAGAVIFGLVLLFLAVLVLAMLGAVDQPAEDHDMPFTKQLAAGESSQSEGMHVDPQCS